MYIGSHVKRMQKEMPSFTIEFCQLLFFFLSGTVKVWDPRQKDDPVANMEPVQGRGQLEPEKQRIKSNKRHGREGNQDPKYDQLVSESA